MRFYCRETVTSISNKICSIQSISSQGTVSNLMKIKAILFSPLFISQEVHVSSSMFWKRWWVECVPGIKVRCEESTWVERNEETGSPSVQSPCVVSLICIQFLTSLLWSLPPEQLRSETVHYSCTCPLLFIFHASDVSLGLAPINGWVSLVKMIQESNLGDTNKLEHFRKWAASTLKSLENYKVEWKTGSFFRINNRE